ncbi:MAG: signal peptidase I [Candidatus Doudnabacteria bacterium]
MDAPEDQSGHEAGTRTETSGKHKNSSFGGFVSGLLLVWDFLKIIILAIIIIVPIRYFIFQPFIVSGSSMEPNFSNGQYLIIDELTYHFSSPQRGQVIVLHYPKDPKQFFIKRIIGLPGEKVEIDNGKVTIFNAQHPNGVTSDEPYLPNQQLSYAHDMTIVGGKKILTLGSDEYFMMGDNRLASDDSRDWGPLKRSLMVGRVLIRVLPLNEWDFYNKLPSYSF